METTPEKRMGVNFLDADNQEELMSQYLEVIRSFATHRDSL